MLELTDQLLEPHVTVDVIVVNPLDQQVRVDGDLFRLLRGDGQASATTSWIGERLAAGTSVQLEVSFDREGRSPSTPGRTR